MRYLPAVMGISVAPAVFFRPDRRRGLLCVHLAKLAGEPPDRVVEAAYHILGLEFLHPIEDFPETWYLQLFIFIIPLIDLSILAQGITDFSFLIFNSWSRDKEWKMAVASTFKDHIVVIG